MASQSTVGRRTVSVVVPVYNEEQAIGPFLDELADVRERIAGTYGGSIDVEILFVNDGSRDATLARILEHQARDPAIRAIDLSRNFGKEAALTAGLVEARGDAVVPLDVDLQDPPELIVEMIGRWLAGAMVVLARRADRSDEGAFKRSSARWFYTLHNRISDIRIPPDVGDFRLMDREVVEAVGQLPENRRFMKGIFAWVGFEPEYVDYKRRRRATGNSKFSGWRLWRFAVEGIAGFSEAPLVMWSYLGALISLMAIAYAIYVVVRTLIFGTDVPGYASLLVGVLFLGGIQLLSIGVLGEYVARVYSEVKRRPPYVVMRRYEPERADDPAEPRARTRKPAK